MKNELYNYIYSGALSNLYSSISRDIGHYNLTHAGDSVHKQIRDYGRFFSFNIKEDIASFTRKTLNEYKN
jgi:hypothetical protein